MDILSDQNKSITGKTNSNVSKALLGIINGMNWFFTLTPDAKFNASTDSNDESGNKHFSALKPEETKTGGRIV